MSRRKANNKDTVVFAGRFSNEDIISGPERSAKSLFTEYLKENKGVFIQYFFDGRKYSIRKKLFGKEEYGFENGILLTLGLFRILFHLLKYKPDVIHLATFERFEIIFFLYKLLYKVRVVYNSHGIVRYENEYIKRSNGYTVFKDKLCEKIYIKYSDAVIFPSNQAVETAKRFYNFCNDKSHIIPNGIDEIFFNSAKNRGTNKKLKAVIINKNTFNTTGTELLMNSLTTAINYTASQIEFYLVTSKKHRLPENIQDFIKVMPLMKPDLLAEFYRDKDIFLSLNYYDTFSISTAEAMASGLIPIVTKETGISVYIEDGINGFTLSYNDKNSLNMIIERLVNMDTGKLNLISNNASGAVERFNWHNIFKMYEEIYKGTDE